MYRWNFILRTLFDVIPLLGTVYLWRALFRARGQPIAGYDFGAMVFYFLLTLLASNLITPADDEWQIATDIREGQLNALLIKPVNYLGYRTSLFLGNRTIHSATILPLVLIVFACFHQYVRLPHIALTWLWTVITLGLAALLQFFLAYARSHAGFLAAGNFHGGFSSSCPSNTFSAGTSFPSTSRRGGFGPFRNGCLSRTNSFFPVSVFLEKTQGALLWKGMAIQTGWVAVMWAVGRLMWSRGLRRYGAFGRLKASPDEKILGSLPDFAAQLAHPRDVIQRELPAVDGHGTALVSGSDRFSSMCCSRTRTGSATGRNGK